MAASQRIAAFAVVVLLVAALLAGQAAADALAPTGRAATGRLVGRTSFAYLTGIRTYVAAVLWARLDPINDGYYQSLPLGQKRFLLPSIRMVTLLDPQFQEPYFVGPWILFEAGLKGQAYQLARDGIAANPGSGWMHGSLTQLLVAEGRYPEAAREADLALAGAWPNDQDRYELLGTLEVAYNKTGQRAKAVAVAAEKLRLEAKLKNAPQAQPTAP